MNSTQNLNPFRPGGPLPPGTSVGRSDVLADLLDRCLTGQSSGVVGDPRVGKSTLLFELRRRLEPFEMIEVVYLDGHECDSSMTSRCFWRWLFGALLGECDDAASDAAIPIRRLLQIVQTKLSASKRRAIILIDEFDRIASHPGLGQIELLQQLRAVSYSSSLVSLVTASRRSLVELTVQVGWCGERGSEPFNHFAEYVLGPLEEPDVAALFERGLPTISGDIASLVRAHSGNHPFLLQCGAASAWSACARNVRREQLESLIKDRLQQEAGRIMEALWADWSPARRRAFVAAVVADSARPNVAASFPWDVLSFEDVETLSRRGLLIRQEVDEFVVPDSAVKKWALRRCMQWARDEGVLHDLDQWQRRTWLAWLANFECVGIEAPRLSQVSPGHPVLRVREPRQALYELLSLLFETGELRIWLRFFSGEEKVLHALPGESASKADFMFKATEILVRTGLIDAPLFDRLLEDFPRQSESVEHVRRLFAGS